MQRVTLGGERISSGKKMKVDLHGYERSTHNLSRVVRTTMSAGTLVPFLDTIALPADTWDIELSCDVMTHPTLGPLLGSYKVDLHVFQAPIRLYNALLHNNMLGIGRDMSQAKLPLIEFTVPETDMTAIEDLNTAQVNPSALPAYLGIRGFGFVPTGEGSQTRRFNATSILAYWEIYKNYYANKQEEIGAVIHTEIPTPVETITKFEVYEQNTSTLSEVPQAPATTSVIMTNGNPLIVTFSGAEPIPETVYVTTAEKGDLVWADISDLWVNMGTTPDTINGQYNGKYGNLTVLSWRYKNANDTFNQTPEVVTFPLSNIDDMRYEILSTPSKVAPYVINTANLEPYSFLYEQPSGYSNVLNTQEGLAVKTYQSDIFNNWLNTENIEAITNASAIDTSGGFFTIDQLLIGKQVYNLLNRINVSGGTYDDWLEVVYDHEAITRCESPIYHGGLIKELVFTELTSSVETDSQPLGQLAGKGQLTSKHKGGKMTIKVDEPSVLIGLISLTPRIDYSQGNEWHTGLLTLDDLHKPQFDQIGFQDLTTTQMAWWDSYWDGTQWTTKSAGKQPAWINYMTDYNKVYGNFAIPDNEMYMVLNRRYEHTADAIPTIKDLTTYIDPSKFNFIFAQTNVDAQNFWAQIGINATVRRKMSAKVMPTI